MSLIYGPLGYLKKIKFPVTCPSIPPCHCEISCQLSLIKANETLPCVLLGANHMLPFFLIGANHLPPRVVLDEREKGLPTFFFAMKSFVNSLLAFLAYFNTIVTFNILQLFKGLHMKKFGFSNCWYDWCVDAPICRISECDCWYGYNFMLQSASMPNLRYVIGDMDDLWGCDRWYANNLMLWCIGMPDLQYVIVDITNLWDWRLLIWLASDLSISDMPIFLPG